MTNENTDKTSTVNSPLTFTLDTESYLKSSAKWSYFLAIMGFILILFLVIIGVTLFSLSTVQNEYSDFQNLPFHFPFAFIGVFYLLLAVLYLFPSFSLMKFGSKIKLAFETNNQSALDDGLKNLKRTFTFFGIMTIISVTLSIIIVPISFFIKHAMTI
jgi:hypothetical protein